MTCSGFEMEQNIGNLKRLPGAQMTDLCFDSDISRIPPRNFTGEGVERCEIWPKFGL